MTMPPAQNVILITYIMLTTHIYKSFMAFFYEAVNNILSVGVKILTLYNFTLPELWPRQIKADLLHLNTSCINSTIICPRSFKARPLDK